MGVRSKANYVQWHLLWTGRNLPGRNLPGNHDIWRWSEKVWDNIISQTKVEVHTWRKRRPGNRNGRGARVCSVKADSSFLRCTIAGMHTGDALCSIGLRADTKMHTQAANTIHCLVVPCVSLLCVRACVCVHQLLTLTLRVSLHEDDVSGVWERRLLGTVDIPEDSNTTAPSLQTSKNQLSARISATQDIHLTRK